MSNTTMSTLFRIFIFLDDVDEDIDDDEENDNLFLSSPTMVNGLEGRVLS